MGSRIKKGEGTAPPAVSTGTATRMVVPIENLDKLKKPVDFYPPCPAHVRRQDFPSQYRGPMGKVLMPFPSLVDTALA